MKKILLVLVAVVAFGGIANASALTAKELVAKLSEDVVINGKTYHMSDGNKKKLESYIEDYGLTTTDATYIATKYDEAIAKAQEIGKDSFSSMSASDKQYFMNIVSEITANTSVNASLTEGGVLTIMDEEGNVIDTFDKKDDIIKTTGYPIAILAIAGAVSVLGISVISKKVAKANA